LQSRRFSAGLGAFDEGHGGGVELRADQERLPHALTAARNRVDDGVEGRTVVLCRLLQSGDAVPVGRRCSLGVRFDDRARKQVDFLARAVEVGLGLGRDVGQNRAIHVLAHLDEPSHAHGVVTGGHDPFEFVADRSDVVHELNAQEHNQGDRGHEAHENFL